MSDSRAINAVIAPSSSSSALIDASSVAGVDRSDDQSSENHNRNNYHRVAVLLCSGCLYLEFPGCLVHNGLLCNIKGNGAIQTICRSFHVFHFEACIIIWTLLVWFAQLYRKRLYVVYRL